MRPWILCLCALAIAVACFYAATSRQSLPALPSAPGNFDQALISQGEALAAIGNCDGCHTADGGARLAGGRAILTPFGTIYSTNITSDRDTGIGTWSSQAFQRALREGISRDGHYLYPAFPYDHFTKITAQDDQALYAYLMSRPPVRAAARNNSVWFLLRFRRLMAFWNAFFLKKDPTPDDPRQTPQWNRGAYLVNGLGHCGACHTPRNLLGAERANQLLAGGRAEGWDSYALNAASPAPHAWTAASLAAFLQGEWQADHGVAQGPMTAVTDDLARAAESDLHAMSVYLAANMARAPDQPAGHSVNAAEDSIGSRIFAASCASCHEGAGAAPFGGIDLAHSSAVQAAEPRNIILLTLTGLPAADGRAAGMMPGFDGAIGDADLAALLRFLRTRFSDQPAWRNLESGIETARRALQEATQP